MPEATVLYTVTAVVVLGLIVWVAAVLKTAREPWARPGARRDFVGEGATTSQDAAGGGAELDAAARDAAKPDADSTARATPVALANEAKAKTAAKGDGDAEA